MGVVRDYLIKITTTTNVAPARETAQVLDEVGKKTEEETKKLEDNAKKTGFLSLKKTELKKLIRELAHEFPIAGMAAKAMLNPIVFTLTSAIGLFTLAKKALDDWNKSMDEAAEKAAQATWAAGMQAKAEAARAAAVAVAEFSQKVKEAGKGEDPFMQMIRNATAGLNAFTAGMGKLYSSEKGEEMAKVENDLANKRITPAQADARRSEIQKKYLKLENDMAEKQQDFALNLKQRELDHAKAEQARLNADAEAKRKKAGAAQGELDAAKADLPEAEKKLLELTEAYRKKADEAEKKRKMVLTTYTAEGRPVYELGPVDPNYAAGALRDRDAQARLVDKLRGITTSYPQSVMPGLNSEASVAEALAVASAGKVTSLSSEIETTRRALAMGRGPGRMALEHQLITADIELQTSLQQRLQANQGEQAQLQGKLAGAKSSSAAQETIAFLGRLTEENNWIKQELAKLNSKLQQTTEQYKRQR